MNTEYVLFEIPPEIMEGLRNGTYTRGHTGVVRDKAGKIICHLKEIGVFQNFSELESTLVGVQQMQALTLGGIACVGAICVAGFVYLGYQIEQVKDQLKDIQNSLNDIKRLLEEIRNDNIIFRVDDYYKAVAAYEEGDYTQGLHLARDCSASIHSYFENVHFKKILDDEKTMIFLMKFLAASMQCQLACAYMLRDNNILKILTRYKKLFLLLLNKINQFNKEMWDSLPDLITLNIAKSIKDKNSRLNHIYTALPIAIELLEDEQHFIDICPKLDLDLLDRQIKNGSQYLVILEPAA